ncbi:hypothetical protein BDC45DRAFT_542734 [Circinella umbellata]|nr:hypothetical protein BDC45DRAFT_542734 [Circinella umbellata]
MSAQNQNQHEDNRICICGSNSHLRRTHSDCPLNECNVRRRLYNNVCLKFLVTVCVSMDVLVGIWKQSLSKNPSNLWNLQARDVLALTVDQTLISGLPIVIVLTTHAIKVKIKRQRIKNHLFKMKPLKLLVRMLLK